MIFKTLILFMCVLLFPFSVLALGPELFDTPEQTPIDGGLAILAAAGGIYAVKKLRDHKK